MWEYLRESIVPELLLANRNRSIRIWSAGCASGEEPFSVAILLAEAMGVEDLGRRVKIYATDVDDEALGEARRADFSDRSVRAVAEELLERDFQPTGQRYTSRLCGLQGAFLDVTGFHDLEESPAPTGSCRST